MSNIFGWANALTGGVDPYQEERDYADNAQKKNRTALGLDANGNPLPPQPDPNQPAQSAAAGQAAASGVMPPAQQPNATKTDPSLGHILVDLQQYQEREQGFEQALGGIGAAVSQPRNRELVRGLFNTTPPDPIKSVQAQMDLAGQQQSQDRMNSLGLMINDNSPAGQKRLQDLATSLNMASPDQLKAAYAANPQAVSQMITQTQQPTPAVANISQIERYIGGVKANKPGTSPEALQLIRNAMLAGAAGPDAEKAVGDAMAYRSSHNGKNAPWVTGNGVDIQKYNQFTADQKTLSDTQATAGSTLAGNVARTEMLRQKVSDLQTNPGLNKILSLPNDSPMKIAAWNRDQRSRSELAEKRRSIRRPPQ